MQKGSLLMSLPKAEMELRKRKYKRMVQWSDEDQVYIASAPEIQGCRTHGDTLEEAWRNLEEAIELCIEVDEDSI